MREDKGQKRNKDTSHPPSWIFKRKNNVTIGLNYFLVKDSIIANMFTVKIYLDL